MFCVTQGLKTGTPTRTRVAPRIHSFNFRPGDIIGSKYEVYERMGKGYEGEVYQVKERGTGVMRAAKLFFPQRNLGGRASRYTARKLHKLRSCPILVQYHAQDEFIHDGARVRMLISDFLDGDLLETLVKREPGKRLREFEAMHLLRTLAAGVAQVHAMREYHGDIHDSNIIVTRRGIWFDVRLIDLYNYGACTAQHIADDVVDIIRVFHDILGGAHQYSRLSADVRYIIAGLKHSLIKRRFRTAGQLVAYLDSFTW